MRKRFAVPGDRRVTGLVIVVPRGAAISSISNRSVVGEPRMLRWRMESDVCDGDARSDGHGESLDAAIQVLIVERVLVMPGAIPQIGDFVAHEPDTIGARSRLDLIHRRAVCTSPNHDGRLLPHSTADRAEVEIAWPATHGVLTVGSVVKHVALGRMTLAPEAFVWDDVISFSEIGRTHVLRRDQVTRVHDNPVRRHVMTVAGMIV